MRFSLATLTRRANPGIRRRSIVIRDITPPAVMASDLYAAAYKPVVAVWEAAIPGLIEEYERTLPTLTTDAPADLQARLDAASSDAERLFIILDAALRDWSLRTEAWQRDKWRSAVLSATGVDLGTLMGPGDVKATLESILAWNVSLVRDVSAEAQRRMSSIIFAGLNQRRPAVDVAKDLREAVAMSRRRSIGIASDQLTKLTAGLAAERRRQAGMSLFKWRHSGKLHPRSWHRARNGNIYSEDASDVGTTVNGDPVLEAPPADDRAGIPPWCGCREQGVIRLD